MQKTTLLAGLQASPGDPLFLEALGSLLEAEQAWGELQEQFRHQLPSLPSGTPIEAYGRYMLGKAAVELGQFDQALPELERSVELKPDFPYTHHLLGRAYRHTGRLKEALAAHQRCLALTPDFSWCWLELGEVQLLLQQPAEAIQSLKAGLRHQSEKDANQLAPFVHAIETAETALHQQQRLALAAELWPERPPLAPDQTLDPIDEMELSLFRFRRVLDRVEAERQPS
jgi:predicted Zn-dependent protease